MCKCLSLKLDHQACVFSDSLARICYDTIRGGNDRVYANFVTSMVWHGLAWTLQKERPWAGRGAGRAHGRCADQDLRRANDHIAPVELRSRPEMSVAEARV